MSTGEDAANMIIDLAPTAVREIKNVGVKFPDLNEIAARKQKANEAGDYKGELEVNNELEAANKQIGEALTTVVWIEGNRGTTDRPYYVNTLNIGSNAQEIRKAMGEAGVHQGWFSAGADGFAQGGCESFLRTSRGLHRIAVYPPNQLGQRTRFTDNQNAFIKERNQQAIQMLDNGYLFKTESVDFRQEPYAGTGQLLKESGKFVSDTTIGLDVYNRGRIPDVDKARWGKQD